MTCAPGLWSKVVALALTALSVYALSQYGTTLFIATPFVSAFVVGYLFNRWHAARRRRDHRVQRLTPLREVVSWTEIAAPPEAAGDRVARAEPARVTACLSMAFRWGTAPAARVWGGTDGGPA